MPSHHHGFVKGPAGKGWRPAKILVDNGSQQPPLMSVTFATDMGLSDIQVDGSECANGDILPVYSVGNVNLTVNGRSEDLKF
jgi:hypothetical protein